MSYVPLYFKAHELVSKRIFESRKESDIFAIFDENLLRDMDTIKEICVSNYGNGTYIVVNNWISGGEFEQRGYRDDVSVGAPKSPHKTGDGFDFDVYRIVDKKSVRVDPEKIRSLIISNRRKLIAVRRIEKGVNWVHVDSMVHSFNP